MSGVILSVSGIRPRKASPPISNLTQKPAVSSEVYGPQWLTNLTKYEVQTVG